MADPVDYLAAEEFIYTTLAGDAALHALVGDRIYSGTAPQKSAYPVIEFEAQGGEDVQEVAGHPIMVNEMYQIKVVGKTNSYADIAPIYARAHALLQRASGAVTNGTVIACVRESPLKYREIDEGIVYSHFGGIYRIQSK